MLSISCIKVLLIIENEVYWLSYHAHFASCGNSNLWVGSQIELSVLYLFSEKKTYK